MKAYERLLKYVVVRTPSDEESGKSPSSECQFKLAGLLKDEMTELGLSDVKLMIGSTAMSMPPFRHPQAARMHRCLGLLPIWILCLIIAMVISILL